MAIGEDVLAYLLSQSTITSLVGTRIRPDYIPQKNDTFPLISYQIVSQVDAHHLKSAAGYAETRIQYDVWASAPLSRTAVTEALRNALSGFPNVSPSTATAGSAVSSAKRLNLINQYEPPSDNTDTGLFRGINDYWFRHSQSVPTVA